MTNERRSRKRARKRNVRRAILQTVAGMGVASVGLLAPNALKLLSTFRLSHSRGRADPIARARRQLVAQGLLRHEGSRLSLTRTGEVLLRKLELAEYKIARPKKWDGRWRVLIFDIPERRKPTREKIRRTLATIGFVRLQDSVWLYPYDCEELITLLKADFRIGKDILYMIVNTLENDTKYRAHFGLRMR